MTFSTIAFSSAFCLAAVAACNVLSSSAAGEARIPDDKSKFHIFLLAGQSNMAGRGVLNATNRISSERVLKLNADGRWVPAEEPLHSDSKWAGAGIGASFARAVADSDPSVTVGLVPAAVGGSSLGQWAEKHSDVAVRRTLRAMEDGELKAILWHQGCADAGWETGVNTYLPKLSNVVSSIRRRLGRPDVPFIAGELGDCLADYKEVKAGRGPKLWKKFNERLHRIGDYIPNSVWVDGSGLRCDSGGIHFDTPSLRIYGQRYADAYFKLCAEKVQPQPGRILLDAPGHVYVEGDHPIARGATPGEPLSITDWRGRPVEASVERRGDGTAVLPSLPIGYYHLRNGANATTFAVVPDPSSRIMDHASFYGVDSAQSWVSTKGSFLCPWNGGDTFRTVSDLIRLAGMPHVRERLRWRDVNPAPESFAYVGSDYMRNADLLHEREMLVSGMFHDAPKWAGVRKRLPTDLNAVFDFCARTAAEFGDRMGDWEFWNEENGGFAPEPVWDYAASMKAAYLGFKAGRKESIALPGAIYSEPGGVYMRTLLDNDAVKFCDAFNYHTYNPPSDYPRLFSAMRRVLARYGAGDMAVWMTESGTNLEGESDKPGVMAEMMAHSPEQELVLAEFYPKSQIAFQMEGVDRNYFFIFGAMNERKGVKDWGVMRRDGTVKPVYAAISAMLRELVSARLEGEMKVGKGLRAYLFSQPDGSQTVAFWSVSPLDTANGGVVKPMPDFARKMTLPVADGDYRLSDLCGTVSTVKPENGALELKTTRFPSYVSGLRGLKADVAPHPRGRVRPYAPKADEDLSVIIRVDLNTNDFAIADQKTRAVLKGDMGRLRLEVWNMDECIKTGRVEVAGVALKGLPPEPIVLGPRGTPPAAFECELAPANGRGIFAQAVFTGVFGGRRSSRLTMPVSFEKRIRGASIEVPISCMDPKAWGRNTSANSFKVSWDEAEQAVRFDVSWKDSGADRWFYPTYRLKLPKESLAGARAVEFEVKSSQNKVENDFRASILMLLYADSSMGARYLSYAPPIGEWETRRIELDCDSNADKATAIRIGANPKGTQCTLWIRNVRIVKVDGGVVGVAPHMEFGDDGTFTFLIVSDWHRLKDRSNTDREIALFKKALARFKPSLVVFGGDNSHTWQNRKTVFADLMKPVIDALVETGTRACFAFGNHDSEPPEPNPDFWSRQGQYNWYKRELGPLFVDYDVPELTGVGTGAVPIFERGKSKPSFKIYIADSGNFPNRDKGRTFEEKVHGWKTNGWDNPYADQIAWYMRESSDGVPHLWFQHIIVPDVYCNGIFVPADKGGPGFLKGVAMPDGTQANLRLSPKATGLCKSRPGAPKWTTYRDEKHTVDGVTLYEAWRKSGCMKGAYFGHDHINSFEGTDANGIRMGAVKGFACGGSYNDYPGFRVFNVRADGTFETWTETEKTMER